ncbi:hypothetical protein FC093_21675 [Ilyomonas limi]|uniref:Lipoprotein n=1 Tax=Ilyomonas limi TaxID=2575867 RepID=A0A4U3KR38_9BACT|nr:hypothetical protein [Ilyomonas limi]TKK64865.1 hypothetical protein FC093_21675 [Ilyomonas limi]
MTRLLLFLTTFLLTQALQSCGQTQKQSVPTSQHLKALAKFVSYEGGDKIHFSKFAILKDFSDTTFAGDTITVGYYFYKANSQQFDTVLLTLNKYPEPTTIKNYFICPDYDAKIGIQQAKIDVIDFEYWEGCETGKGDCKPLTFTRTASQKNWFLIMPCGGTETEISLAGIDHSFNQKLHLFHDGCPPCIELTNMRDGKYSANMVACGLGGQVNFSLATTGATKNGR